MSEEKMRDSQWQQAGWIASWLTRHAINLETGPFVELQDHLAALQESEAGAVPFGYLDRQQLERWERLRGTKYAAAEIGYIGFSKEPFETDLTDCTAPVFLAPPAAQAIETAAIMKCVEVCQKTQSDMDDQADSITDFTYKDAFEEVEARLIALIPQDGRTQLEQKCMGVANAAFDFGYYDCESPAVDCVEPKLRAIVTNLIGEK